MNRQDTKRKRSYDSSLRAEQAEQTRGRILEAVVEQIVDGGMTDFSIERVAQRAGVSTRTVYHHFANRDELFDAVLVWLDEKAAITQPSYETVTLEDLLALVSHSWESFDEHEVLIRAMLMTELGREIRERGRSKRRPKIEAVVRRTAPEASAAEVQRLASLIHYLTSSEAWRSMKDESGLTGRQAGEAIVWAIEALFASLKGTGNAEGVTEGEHNDDS